MDRLAAGAGSPGDGAGAVVGAPAQGGERLGGAHVPGRLGHLELLGVLVGILVVGGAGGLLVLLHPLFVHSLLHVLVLQDLKNINCKKNMFDETYL